VVPLVVLLLTRVRARYGGGTRRFGRPRPGSFHSQARAVVRPSRPLIQPHEPLPATTKMPNPRTDEPRWYLVPNELPGAIVSGGSPDSVLTSAEVLRRMSGETEVVVTMANEVHNVRAGDWAPGTQVVLVGLSVSKPKRELTLAFLEALQAADHALVAIVDEHSAIEWDRALDAVGMSMDELKVQPASQDSSNFRSAGRVLLEALGSDADDHGRALLEAADAADNREYQANALAYCTNAALKSAPDDQARKPEVVRWLASSSNVLRLAGLPGGQEVVAGALVVDDKRDAQVWGWVREYAMLEGEHERILREARDEGEGIVSFSIERPVDMTALTKSFYDRGAKVVFYEADFYNRPLGKRIREVGLGTDDRKLKLFQALEAGGVQSRGGTARKPRVSLEDGPRALEVIRRFLGDRRTEAEV